MTRLKITEIRKKNCSRPSFPESRRRTVHFVRLLFLHQNLVVLLKDELRKDDKMKNVRPNQWRIKDLISRVGD